MLTFVVLDKHRTRIVRENGQIIGGLVYINENRALQTSTELTTITLDEMYEILAHAGRAPTKQTLINTREQIQEDLMCVLDGIDEPIMTNACQVIVDRFKPLI